MCEQLIPGPFQELTVEGGCLLWRMQVVIPKKSQGQILTKTTQELALGSPLAPTKNKNGGGEPGANAHVILWHDNFFFCTNDLKRKRMLGWHAKKYANKVGMT